MEPTGDRPAGREQTEVALAASFLPSPTSEDQWWTPKRAALHRWLEQNAPALAPVYESATRMALDDAFPGRVWFVAHAIREIRNRLPDAVAGEVAAGRTDYPRLAGAVHEQWIQDGLPPDGARSINAPSEPSASEVGRTEVSAELIRAVADLVAGHLAAGDNNEANARRLFEALGGVPPPMYVVKAWLRGTRWANAFAHVRNKPLSLGDEQSLALNFVAFEDALMAISSRSYENMESLDEILGAANR